jgi:hypothetical protein
MAATVLATTLVLFVAAMFLLHRAETSHPEAVSVLARPTSWLCRSAALSLFLLIPLTLCWGPWVEMTARCGHQPIYMSNFAGGNDAYQPGMFGYDRVWWLGSGYVCSVADAQKNNYQLYSGL